MLVYDISTNSKHCITNVCICPNGEAPDFCTEHKAYKCASCNPGFLLSGDNCVACPQFTHIESHSVTEEEYCSPNVCVCENGIASADCPADGMHFCESCDEGYESIGNECQKIINVCTCPSGPAAKGDACHTDGAVVCAGCYSEGFKLSEDLEKCVAKVCQCENGKPYTDGTCIDESSYRCVACNDGFELKMNWIGDIQVDVCIPAAPASPVPASPEEPVESPEEPTEVTSCEPGFTLVDNSCQEAPDTYVLLPGTHIKQSSALELQNGQCLGLVNPNADGSFGELRPYNCDHPNVIHWFYYIGKEKAIFGKKDKNGVFNKGRACIVRSIDDNGKTRLHTVKCNSKPYPENADYNKKKGIKRYNLPTNQWYVSASGDDIKTFLMFPHWDPIN